jgi:hypothetical protein
MFDFTAFYCCLTKSQTFVLLTFFTVLIAKTHHLSVRYLTVGNSLNPYYAIEFEQNAFIQNRQVLH